VARLVGGREVTSVTFDASRVTFLDSGGLTALLAARTTLQALGIDFRLGPVSDQVRHVIDIAGLAEDLLPDT
jgi:anti-anti-sigma factor